MTQNAPPAKEYKLLEPGVRKARVVESAWTKNNKNKAQFAVKFVLLDGPDSGNHIVWWGGFDSPQAIKYSISAMKTMGYDEKTPIELFKPSKEVSLVLEPHTIPATQGKPERKITRVKFINSLDGSGGASFEKNKLSGSELKSTADAIMASYRQISGAGGDGATAATTEAANSFGAPEPGEDDQLPF